jgi:hypothetical protein
MCISPLLLAQELKKEYQSIISNFIDCVRRDKKETIADMVHYPFERIYPLPSIKNKTDFVQNYSIMFDDALKNEIVSSDVSKNWTKVGWRGIMLNQGTVWIDFNGRLIALPKSGQEEIKRRQIIESERKILHPSLRTYLNPICILETTKFRIRIDDIDGSYRYASWSIDKAMSVKPDFIIEHGKKIWDGTGGNHHYDFTDGEYTYECFINLLSNEDSPPASLMVSKGENVILSQAAKIVK